jgi:hypothetical protein
LRRAHRLLTRLEAKDGAATPQLDLFCPVPEGDQPPEAVAHESILGDLRALSPDELSPRAAHEALRQLHERLLRVEARGG